jgi:UDP-glucuronate 4-epimerase
MNILVTGCAGFIGSHTSEKLLELGNKVIGIDNLNNYYEIGFKKKNLERLKKSAGFKFYEDDILNWNSLEKVFEENKIDKIIHLAARAGVRPSIDNPLLYEEVNVRGTLNLLEMARKFKLRSYLCILEFSLWESKESAFSETDKLDNPISPYAATKKSCELLCYNYAYLYEYFLICLRFFTVYDQMADGYGSIFIYGSNFKRQRNKENWRWKQPSRLHPC